MVSLAIVLSVGLWSLGFFSTVFGTWYAVRKNRAERVRLSPAVAELEEAILPGVSILKPLKGLDPDLEKNLLRFFVLDYPKPKFELLFSVADARDPVLPVVRRLIAEHPGVRARVFTGSSSFGLNPKINNMLRAYEQAQFDRILISDSTIRIEAPFLRELALELTDGVGVVTAVVVGEGPRGPGGYLEAIYLNTFFARWMRIAEGFGRTSVIGKTMYFRRSVAERFGGLRGLSHYVAEDYQCGLAMEGLGLKATIKAKPVTQHIGAYRFRDFWARHVRWGRIRRSQAPFLHVFELFLGVIPAALAGLVALENLGLPVSLCLILHFAVWLISDGLMIHSLGVRVDVRWFAAWGGREILAIPLWLHAALGSTISWRGTKLTILPGGILQNRSLENISFPATSKLVAE